MIVLPLYYVKLNTTQTEINENTKFILALH